MDGKLSIGGNSLEDILRQLRTDLENYFGSVNELKAGLRKDLEPKPAALEWRDLVRSTGLPIVSGGLIDQPHIWLQQWELCDAVEQMFIAVKKHNEQAQQS